MIIAKPKPLKQVVSMIEGYESVLVVGCGSCVTVCLAGGEKEVAVLSSALRLSARRAGNNLRVEEANVERQCEWEFIEPLKEQVESVEAVLSLACGVGVQTMTRKYETKLVYPGLDTCFMGMPEEQGLWTENCGACGECVLHLTGGVCPIARCAKSLLNGPCGGAQDGKCEIDEELDCAWQLIYDRLQALGKLRDLEQILPAKDWSLNRDGGPRKVVREDVRV